MDAITVLKVLSAIPVEVWSIMLLSPVGIISLLFWMYLQQRRERDAIIVERNETQAKYESLLIQQNENLKQEITDYNDMSKTMHHAIELFKRTPQ